MIPPILQKSFHCAAVIGIGAGFAAVMKHAALLRDRELMFSLSDVGIVYLRGGRIERANQAMAVLTGYADSELTALDPAELAGRVPDRSARMPMVCCSCAVR